MGSPSLCRHPRIAWFKEYAVRESVVLLCSLSLLLGLLIGSSLLYVVQILFGSNIETQCIMQLSDPSPVLEDIDVRYHEQTFNGSFTKQTIYRHDASPEVDAAWKALGVDCKGFSHS